MAHSVYNAAPVRTMTVTPAMVSAPRVVSLVSSVACVKSNVSMVTLGRTVH